MNKQIRTTFSKQYTEGIKLYHNIRLFYFSNEQNPTNILTMYSILCLSYYITIEIILLIILI